MPFKVALRLKFWPPMGQLWNPPWTLTSEETEKINFSKIINKIVLFFLYCSHRTKCSSSFISLSNFYDQSQWGFQSCLRGFKVPHNVGQLWKAHILLINFHVVTLLKKKNIQLRELTSTYVKMYQVITSLQVSTVIFTLKVENATKLHCEIAIKVLTIRWQIFVLGRSL